MARDAEIGGRERQERTPETPAAARTGRRQGWRFGPRTKVGAVAQLGERLLCKQEVIGSIPFSSTIVREDDGWGRGERSRTAEDKGLGLTPGGNSGRVVGHCG